MSQKIKSLIAMAENALKEAFSNWRYNLPNDKELQLYDFYMLTSLPEPDDINLETSLNEAKKSLIDSLYPAMLEAVYFALCCSYRNIIDDKGRVRRDRKTVLQEQDVFYRQNGVDGFLDTYKEYLGHKDYGDEKGSSSKYDWSYNALEKTLKDFGKDRRWFVENLLEAYNEDWWYSGDAQDPRLVKWREIAKGWIRLDNANSLDEKIIAIDTIFSLHHNSGSLFDKLRDYYKSGYYWLQNALDLKRDIKDTRELWPRISTGLKSFAAAVIKDATGKTLQDFIPDPKKTW